MAKLILNGATSGSVTLDAPAVSGTTTLTLPTTSGTVITTATSQTLTSPVIAGTPTGVGVLTSDTAKTATGTSVDFTSIPSWVKRITVMFSGVSTNGTSNILIQIGDSGGIEDTGYISTSDAAGTSSNSTAGFVIRTANASNVMSGHMILTAINGNLWISSSVLKQSTTIMLEGAGDKTLSATLDRVRITTVNGTDTFDAGTINILYE